MVVWGTLTRFACEGAVAEMPDGGPLRPLIGVPCEAEAAQARLLPDGGVIYRDPDGGRVLAVVADRPVRDGGALEYPSRATLVANDIDVAPGCGADDGGSNPPGRFFVRPTTGSVVYECDAGLWHQDSSGPVAFYTDADLIALGYSNSALAVVGGFLVVITSTGAAVAVPPSGFIPHPARTRAHPQGFLTVKESSTACELFLIKFDGSLQKQGDYAAGGLCAGRIDEQGVMYYGSVSVFQTLVVRRPLAPELSSFVFGTDTAPTNWASGPTYHLQMIDGNGLITGP